MSKGVANLWLIGSLSKTTRHCRRSPGKNRADVEHCFEVESKRLGKIRRADLAPCVDGNPKFWIARCVAIEGGRKTKWLFTVIANVLCRSLSPSRSCRLVQPLVFEKPARGSPRSNQVRLSRERVPKQQAADNNRRGISKSPLVLS